MRDFYDVLGVQKAHLMMKLKKLKKLALKYHLIKILAMLKLKKILKKQRAYSILSDSQKKVSTTIWACGVGMDLGGGFGGGVQMDMEDIFSQFGDIFGGVHLVIYLEVVDKREVDLEGQIYE